MRLKKTLKVGNTLNILQCCILGHIKVQIHRFLFKIERFQPIYFKM